MFRVYTVSDSGLCWQFSAVEAYIGFHVQKSANERYSIYILDTV